MIEPRFRKILAVGTFSTIAVVPISSAAQNYDSIYTTYNWQKDCDRVDPPPAEGDPQMGADLVCPGPNGLKLMLADGDARVSMDYGPVPAFGPWESFRSFNMVHGTVEWRRQPVGGQLWAFATIQRWSVWMAEQEYEMLVVSTVSDGAGSESCIVAVIDANRTADANVLARQVADRYASDFTCGSDRSRAFGDVGLNTPLPRRVPPQ